MKKNMTNVLKILLVYLITFQWDVTYGPHRQNMIDCAWQIFFCSQLNTYIGLAIVLHHYCYVQDMYYYSVVLG